MQDRANSGVTPFAGVAVRFKRRSPLHRWRHDRRGLRLLELVSADRGIAAPMLLHRSRCRAEVALARQLAMYLMHVILSRQYAEVGRFFGRDRTTVWYACALIEDMREDPGFDAEVEALAEALRADAELDEALDVAC